MIKLGNGLQDAYACIPLELTIAVNMFGEHVSKVARSKTASAHERKTQYRLKDPTLEVVAKFVTTAKLVPGKMYVDQQHVLYIAQDSQIFQNISRVLGISRYEMPQFLMMVSDSNVSKLTQFTM